jgi:hypothetical protein
MYDNKPSLYERLRKGMEENPELKKSIQEIMSEYGCGSLKEFLEELGGELLGLADRLLSQAEKDLGGDEIGKEMDDVRRLRIVVNYLKTGIFGKEEKP